MKFIIASHVLIESIDLLKKRVKREFKADGFGRIDQIIILSVNPEGFAEVKVGFRPSDKLDVLQLRDTVYYQVCEQPVRMNLTHESREGYWILSLDRSPSDNSAISENILQKMDDLEDKVKRQQDVIYQLIGGVFNHDTQGGSVDILVRLLLKMEPSADSIKNDSKWTVYPTTRQGDDNERRIDELEKMQANFTYEIKDLKNMMCAVTYGLQELGASLFNQETQKQSWRELRDIFIHDGVYDDLKEPLVNTSKWTHPTTRQGDELERRFDELEGKLACLGTLFPQKITEERQSVSFDLCGNA